MSNLEEAVAITALADAVSRQMQHRSQPGRRTRGRLMSVDEAAEALRMSRSTLYRELGAGTLPSVKIGRRRLVPASAIAQRIASAVTTPETP